MTPRIEEALRLIRARHGDLFEAPEDIVREALTIHGRYIAWRLSFEDRYRARAGQSPMTPQEIAEVYVSGWVLQPDLSAAARERDRAIKQLAQRIPPGAPAKRP